MNVASAHAKPGRALAAFGSLLDRMPADLPVTVVVTGKTVLSLTCPQLPLATMACGAGKAPQFRTLQPIPFDRSRVLVNTTDRSGAEVRGTNSMDPAIAPILAATIWFVVCLGYVLLAGMGTFWAIVGRRDRPYAGCAGWRLPVSR